MTKIIYESKLSNVHRHIISDGFNDALIRAFGATLRK